MTRTGLDRTVAALTLLFAACETPASSGGGCRQDSECSSLEACVAGACVPRVVGPYNLAVFVVPPAGVARSELPPQAFSTTLTTLTLVPEIVANGSARSQPNSPFALASQGELSLTFVLPPTLPGFPALELYAVAELSSAGGVVPFKLGFPQTRLGQTAKVLVSPRAPLDLVLPPVELAVVLAANIEVPLPGIQELRAVEGLIRNEFDQPALGYTARVFRGTTLVSNRSVPAAEDGRFRISYLREATPELAGLPPTLELAATARPRVRVPLADTTADLGPIRLPAHPVSRTFRIPVVSTDAMGLAAPVAGALVRLATPLTSASSAATAAFVQQAQTGFDGAVEVALIPGALELPKSYKLQITSPGNSDAASRCIERFEVGPGIDAEDLGTPTTATVELPRRPALAGVIKRADLAPLRRAVLRAVRTGPLPGGSDCAALAGAAPASVTTDKEGAFRLRLEAGLYRLEIHPTASDAAPLWFINNVVVSNEGLAVELTLPRGQVLDARVIDPNSLPCQLCQVSFLAPVAEGPAVLRAEGITDYDGRIRVIVPAL